MIGVGRLFLAAVAAVAAVPGLRRVPPPRAVYPDRAVWFPGSRTWYLIRARHLLVGRGRKLLSRSRGEVTSLSRLGVVTASSDAVACQHDHKLWIASLHGLGLAANSGRQPAGRLVELQDDHRLVLLRGDGSLFARTALPAEGISAPLVPAPNGRSVAFTAGLHPGGHIETIYLLRPGARTAIALRHEHVDFAGCGLGASMQRRGHWLLYSTTEGNLAVTRAHRTIDLSDTDRRLTGEASGAWWGA